MAIKSKRSLKGSITIKNVVEDETQTYILVDESGYEIPAVLVDEEVDLTATANDIRLGAVAVTDDGVVTGEKFIPPYYTTAGVRLVPSGSEYDVPLQTRDAYDYTELQCIVCKFNDSLPKSVAAEKVVIEDKVYNAGSIDVISTAIKDAENKTVKLGVVNDSGLLHIIRFFTYKEEQ